MPAQCSALGSSVLVATLGPDFGIAVALVGFYISSMIEVNLLVERKINRIRRL